MSYVRTYVHFVLSFIFLVRKGVTKKTASGNYCIMKTSLTVGFILALLGVGHNVVDCKFHKSSSLVVLDRHKTSSSIIQSKRSPTFVPKRKPTDIIGGSQDVEGTATIPNEIFNLVKSIVGAGVLSLPAGIAAFGNAPSAILPSSILILVIGGISAYGFSLIGRVCADTGARSYREAWEKTVGSSTSWITAASSTFNCLIANLAYSMILADTFKNLLSGFGLEISRQNVLFGVTLIVLVPLCLMKNLSSLAPFSLLGIMGMAYTIFVMAVRYFDGSYNAPNGKFLVDVAENLKPSFGDNGASAVMSPKSLILICMLSTAYMAHFNAPKFYVELKNNTIKRYNTVVMSSFGISIAIFVGIAAFGFLTFGSTSDGLILNNYSNKDSLMSFSRIAVAISIVFSYPLVFVGTRDGLFDLANVAIDKRSNSLVNNVTLATLAAITFAALKVKDLSFVLSFGGATVGTALIYVFPALMYRKVVQSLEDNVTSAQRGEVVFALFTAMLGLGMGVIGTKMSLEQ